MWLGLVHFLKDISYFILLGLKGNLSLLDMFSVFQGTKTQMQDLESEISRKKGHPTSPRHRPPQPRAPGSANGAGVAVAGRFGAARRLRIRRCGGLQRGDVRLCQGTGRHFRLGAALRKWDSIYHGCDPLVIGGRLTNHLLKYPARSSGGFLKGTTCESQSKPNWRGVRHNPINGCGRVWEFFT